MKHVAITLYDRDIQTKGEGIDRGVKRCTQKTWQA